ncbi:hypothetical protein DRO33_01105 [Candidatus Bathyarchaeota archaeon]|nr:MAG: hypothetical protein DRO33_01105 [Candidatus Bathyarchaeota archaeon]
MVEARDVARRLVRAALAAGFTYAVTYYLPMTFLLGGETASLAEPVITPFAVLCIFFSAMGELLKGTGGQYVLEVVRGFAFVAYFSFTVGGGELVFVVPTDGAPVVLAIDMTVFFFVVIIISLIEIAIPLLKAIFYFIEREEEELEELKVKLLRELEGQGP